MIGQLISHYRILEKLGEGGMGVVYKAEDCRLGRNVALKFLAPELTRDPKAKARFVQEAEAASALDHPNVYTIYEIDESEDGRLFIAMACYDGETLKDRISRGAMKLEEALDIAWQVTQGLVQAHKRGIVHRDIKPANIFITRDGLVKIVDFGLAKLAGKTQLTRTGTPLGTVAYMSPEQARGEELDGQSDIWSLGVILFEMIAGGRPFCGDFDSAVIYNILNSVPISLTSLRPEVPSGLATIVACCLAKDRAERYQSAEDLLADLRQVADGGMAASLETVGLPPTRPRLTGFDSRRLRLGLVVAAVLLAWVSIHYLVGTGPSPPGGRIMLAVLPFANLGLPEDGALCAGITDVITARLAGIKGLGVVSRQSTLPYRESTLSAREIGSELGVEYILEGTIQRESSSAGSGRVRIVPQLISVADDIHVWAGTFDESLEEVFEAETSIARRVAHELDITLLAPASMASVDGFFDREATLEQAQLQIIAGVAAYERVPPAVETARGLFDSATRSLIACGLLKPGEQRGEDLARSFRMALGQTAGPKIVKRDFASIMASLDNAPDDEADEIRKYSLEEELSQIVAEFGVDVSQQPIPPSLVQRVQHFVHLYTNDWRSFSEESLSRSRALLPMVHQELLKFNLPKALAGMPFILSGYDPALGVDAGARGLWRFMPETARDYGLVVEPPNRDDRTDPYKDTIAACQHFDYLLKLFGSSDPLCAVAAYNAGAAGLARCLREEGDWRSPWRFWDLVEKGAPCLSKETQSFVPRFLAAVVVMRRPDASGMAE